MVAVDETCNYFKIFHPRSDTSVSDTLRCGNVCLFHSIHDNHVFYSHIVIK